MPSNNGKKTIFIMTDLAGTGFGRVGEEICKRFALTQKYNIVYVGWASTGDPNVHFKWKELNVVVEPTRRTADDQFGQASLPHLVEKYHPDLIWTLGDPWMVEHVANLPQRRKFKWISYVPIDRDVLPKAWHHGLKDPDVLVLYSKFGQEVVERTLPRIKTEMIYHGVDTEVFQPQNSAEIKQRMGVRPDTFVAGMVARNQIRKRIPRLMNAFKAYNCANVEQNYCSNEMKWRCELCPKFKQSHEKHNSALHLHTTKGYTDGNDGLWVGWHIDEYAERYKLNDNPYGTPSKVFIPDSSRMKTLEGVTDAELCSVYNTFDVHVLPTCREGFGLPVIEAMACGIPTIATNYSSVVELCSEGRGLLADVAVFDEEPFWDAPSAIVDVGSIVEKLNLIPQLIQSGEWMKMKEACRRFALRYQWKIVFKQWNRLFNEVLS